MKVEKIKSNESADWKRIARLKRSLRELLALLSVAFADFLFERADGREIRFAHVGRRVLSFCNIAVLEIWNGGEACESGVGGSRFVNRRRTVRHCSSYRQFTTYTTPRFVFQNKRMRYEGNDGAT